MVDNPELAAQSSLDALFTRLSANPRFRSLFIAWLVNRADAEDSAAFFDFCETWIDGYISLDTHMGQAFEQLRRGATQERTKQ